MRFIVRVVVGIGVLFLAIFVGPIMWLYAIGDAVLRNPNRTLDINVITGEPQSGDQY